MSAVALASREQSFTVVPLDLSVELVDVPCRQHDPDLWFADLPADLEFAKALCQTCPVKLDCLAGALERAEPWGVWGGEIFDQGAIVPRKRPRGRPSRDDLAREEAMRIELAAKTELLLSGRGAA